MLQFSDVKNKAVISTTVLAVLFLKKVRYRIRLVK